MTDTERPPAPHSAQLIAQAESYLAKNYGPIPVVLQRGQGAFLWDVEGKRYTDCLSGYSALTQGHCHPRIVEAAIQQLNTLTLASRVFHHEGMAEFASTLARITGFPRVLPMNTGAEAVETAIKCMRRWGYRVKGVPQGKAEIIVAERNFHGRTSTIVSFSSDPTSYSDFGPPMPGFVKVPFGDAEKLAAAITPNTAGVLLEPIQGEAGVVIPPDDYLPKVRQICTDHRVAMVLDEVQTGLGRTGKMFGWQHWGAKPDAVTLGKALSGGILPVSAMCGEDWLLGVFTPGSHGSTFGGSPMATAVAVAALAVIEDENLPERARILGERAVTRLREGLAGVDKIHEIRSKGLMIAIQFKEDVAHDYALSLADRGILLKDAHGHTLRILPPAVIAEADLDAAVDVIVDELRG